MGGSAAGTGRGPPQVGEGRCPHLLESEATSGFPPGVSPGAAEVPDGSARAPAPQRVTDPRPGSASDGPGGPRQLRTGPGAQVSSGRAREPRSPPDGPGSPGQLRTGPEARDSSRRVRRPGTAPGGSGGPGQLQAGPEAQVSSRRARRPRSAPDGPGSPGQLRTGPGARAGSGDRPGTAGGRPARPGSGSGGGDDTLRPDPGKPESPRNPRKRTRARDGVDPPPRARASP